MQWTNQRNGGFSRAEPEDLVRPVTEDGPFGSQTVNVAAPRSDPGSLLNWLADLIRCHVECPELGNGRWEVLQIGADCVFGIGFGATNGGHVIVLNNLSPTRRTVRLDPNLYCLEQAVDLFCDHPYPRLADSEGKSVMSGYGYRWIRIFGDDLPPEA